MLYWNGPVPRKSLSSTKLVQFGVEEVKAKSFVKIHREATEAQIAAYPYRGRGSPEKTHQGGLSLQ